MLLGKTETSNVHFFTCCLVLSTQLFNNTSAQYESICKITYCLQSTIEFIFFFFFGEMSQWTEVSCEMDTGLKVNETTISLLHLYGIL